MVEFGGEVLLGWLVLSTPREGYSWLACGSERGAEATPASFF